MGFGATHQQAETEEIAPWQFSAFRGSVLTLPMLVILRYSSLRSFFKYRIPFAFMQEFVSYKKSRLERRLSNISFFFQDNRLPLAVLSVCVLPLYLLCAELSLIHI